MDTLPNSASDESRRQYLSRVFRTFVAVFFVLAAGSVLGLSTLGTARSRSVPPIADWLVLPALLVVSAVVAGWLVDGGYERLGADPAAAGEFGWLAFLYVPVALLPMRAAFVAAGFASVAGYAFLVVAAIALAGWLTLFGGLDRLGLEPRHVAHAAGVAVALYLCGSIVGSQVAPERFLTPVWIGSAAVGAQGVALWLGFGGYVDRFLA